MKLVKGWIYGGLALGLGLGLGVTATSDSAPPGVFWLLAGLALVCAWAAGRRKPLASTAAAWAEARANARAQAAAVATANQNVTVTVGARSAEVIDQVLEAELVAGEAERRGGAPEGYPAPALPAPTPAPGPSVGMSSLISLPAGDRLPTK